MVRPNRGLAAVLKVVSILMVFGPLYAGTMFA